jgi:thiosulfate/3-mercaptopyruvate sulfurtransferase
MSGQHRDDNAAETLISAEQLQARLDHGERTVLLDVRWALGDPHGREHYLRGHLPGAVFVDLPGELAGAGTATDGRHPLPTPFSFQEAARRWGIRSTDTVAVYDDGGNMSAARLWWLLRYGGFQRVLLLDGGLGAWRAAGYPLASGAEEAVPGDVVIHYGQLPVVDVEAAGQWPAHGVLLDARAGERYRGETEPVDPRAGHIPGAVSAPTSANLAPDQTFLPAEELRERFAGLGISSGTDVAVYCGSGVTAAHEILALHLAGIPAALFPGSWSAWSNHPGLPVATGPRP